MITTVGRYRWLKIEGEHYKVARGDFDPLVLGEQIELAKKHLDRWPEWLRATLPTGPAR